MQDRTVNYYAELNLDPGASQEELEEQLKKMRRIWISRASTGANPAKRQEAEQKVVLIREATELLLDKKKREKYDRQLDQMGEAGTAEQQEFDEPATSNTSFLDNAALMDMLESCYNNSQYNQAIAAANKLIENGAADVATYRYLILCYTEKGEENRAYQTLELIKKAFPDDPDALLLISMTLLRGVTGKEKEARPYLDRLIQMGYGEHIDVTALDIEYQIDCGNVEAAEQKTNAFISQNGRNQDFCISIANAYVQAANKNATEYGGDVYFETKEDFNNFSSMIEKANDLYVFEGNDQLLKNYKKTTMVQGWWIGVLCSLLYGYAAFSINSWLLGIVCFAFAGALIYYSRVPNWMSIRYRYKKHLIGLYEVFRIINIVVSLWLRISWAACKFVFRIIFAFL